jgi:hypothetical protein
MSLERKSRALAVRRRRFAVLWVALGLLVALGAGMAAMSQNRLPPTPVGGAPVIGEAPAIAAHVNQKEIDRGRVSLAELIRAGNDLFVAFFNTLDGAGRPQSTRAAAPAGRPRHVFPENFNRFPCPFRAG